MDIFQEMQMMALLDSSTVLDTRKELRRIVDFWRNQPFQQDYVKWFCNPEMRNLSVDVMNDIEGFMVPDDFPIANFPEELRHESFGFCKESHFIYSGRFVYPVKDVRGNIMGFVGYDKFEEPKYLDSKNHGYKAKSTTFFGMEKLPEYYKSDHIIIVEGIVCMAWLRQERFNAVASLGSYLNPYASRIFRRFGNKAIFIPDGDEAGAKYAKSVKFELPQSRVLRPITDKDVDDTRNGKAKNLSYEAQQLHSARVAEELRNIVKNPFCKREFFG